MWLLDIANQKTRRRQRTSNLPTQGYLRGTPSQMRKSRQFRGSYNIGAVPQTKHKGKDSEGPAPTTQEYPQPATRHQRNNRSNGILQLSKRTPDHNGHQRWRDQGITLSTLSRRHKLHRKVGKLRSLRKRALPPLPFFRDNPLTLYSLHLQIKKVRPVLPLPNNKQPFTSNLKPKDDSESLIAPYSDYSSSILCKA